MLLGVLSCTSYSCTAVKYILKIVSGTLPCLCESLNIRELDNERRRLILVKVGVVAEPVRFVRNLSVKQFYYNYLNIQHIKFVFLTEKKKKSITY